MLVRAGPIPEYRKCSPDKPHCVTQCPAVDVLRRELDAARQRSATALVDILDRELEALKCGIESVVWDSREKK